MSFTGKTVLITGGASGIGLMTGKCMAKEGANVSLVDINKDALDKAVNDISVNGGNAIGVLTDIREYSQVKNAVNETLKAYGSIDILINSAGGASRRVLNRSESFDNMPIEVLDWGIDVNLKGPLYFSRAVFGHI